MNFVNFISVVNSKPLVATLSIKQKFSPNLTYWQGYSVVDKRNMGRIIIKLIFNQNVTHFEGELVFIPPHTRSV